MKDLPTIHMWQSHPLCASSGEACIFCLADEVFNVPVLETGGQLGQVMLSHAVPKKSRCDCAHRQGRLTPHPRVSKKMSAFLNRLLAMPMDEQVQKC